MIKAIFCMRRLPRLNRQQFKKRIEATYQADLRRFAKEFGAASIKLYSRSGDIKDALSFASDSSSPLDAVLELSWRDQQSFRHAVEKTKAKGGLGLIFAKLAHIADLTRSQYLVLNRSGGQLS